MSVSAPAAQLDQQKAQTDAIHQQVKLQGEIGLAKIKAGLDAKMALLDAHLKAATERQKMQNAQSQHQMNVAETALRMVATAHSHDTKMQQSAKD